MTTVAVLVVACPMDGHVGQEPVRVLPGRYPLDTTTSTGTHLVTAAYASTSTLTAPVVTPPDEEGEVVTVVLHPDHWTHAMPPRERAVPQAIAAWDHHAAHHPVPTVVNTQGLTESLCAAAAAARDPQLDVAVTQWQTLRAKVAGQSPPPGSTRADRVAQDLAVTLEDLRDHLHRVNGTQPPPSTEAW